MRKTIALLLAVMMVFAIFAGCGKKDSGTTTTTTPGATTTPANDGTGETGGESNGVNTNTIEKDAVHPSDTATIRYAAAAAPQAMTIQGNGGPAASALVTELFYDTLFTYDNTNSKVLPCLGTAWEWVSENVLRVTLRDDVKSHLGDPFTASDVVYSIKWGCETPKLNTYYSSIFDMENTKVVDDYTVDIAVKVPDAFLAEKLTSLQYTMLVEASVEKLGGQDQVAYDPSAGTGSYKLVKWDQTDNVVYAERNEDYWGVKPYYKNYEYYVVGDATARAMGVESGDFDACYQPNSTDVIAAEGNKALTCYFSHGSSGIRWDFNSDREPFNIKEVRQALAMLVNYEAIGQVAYTGYCDTVDSPYPASNAWHTSPDAGEENYFRYDPEAAKQKLIDAGYPNGFEMHIMCVSGRSYIVSSLEVIQNSLKQVGINVIIDQYESATYGSYFTKGDYDSVLNNASSPLPSNYLKCCNPSLDFSSGSTCGKNWCADINDEVVDLIYKCNSTLDMEECFKYLDQFQDLCREYVPFVVTANPYAFDMVKAEIVNVSLDLNCSPYITQFYPADYLAA